jgi:curli biogenesis system outer membrane secretion channel CsgG
MRPTNNPFLRVVALPFVLMFAASGCATLGSSLDVKTKTVQETAKAKTGPEAAPHRSITGFSSALRCMDNMLIDYGVRDVSMLVEEIVDQTKKVNAGTRDMLITAMSEMTRRSRAVRLVAYGKDSTNVIAFLQSAQRQSAYEAIPQFDIKGSITQWDENVIRNQKDLGVSYQPYLNLGISRDAASSILALDLSVLRTDDLSLLPGVTSRNSVVILRQGKGFDADAAYSKFGISYAMNFQQSEGQAQALRGLVELAVIELVGKLTRTPYWTCLGVTDGAANDEINQEISDWYYAMAANPPELIGYFQYQLRRRGFYEGPVDGAFNPAIDEAIANYRVALGLSNQALLDPAFFEAFLLTDHTRIPRPAKPAVLAPAQGKAPAGAPLRLKLASANNQTRFAPGERFSVLVQPSEDAHVYCYLQDENAKITRFYPNRFAKDSLVPAAQPLRLPGSMRFELVMNTKGVKETVSCFGTRRDVSAALPGQMLGTDFVPLAVGSIDQIRTAFAAASGGTVTEEILHVQAK